MVVEETKEEKSSDRETLKKLRHKCSTYVDRRIKDIERLASKIPEVAKKVKANKTLNKMIDTSKEVYTYTKEHKEQVGYTAAGAGIGTAIIAPSATATAAGTFLGAMSTILTSTLGATIYLVSSPILVAGSLAGGGAVAGVAYVGFLVYHSQTTLKLYYCIDNLFQAWEKAPDTELEKIKIDVENLQQEFAKLIDLDHYNDCETVLTIIENKLQEMTEEKEN